MTMPTKGEGLRPCLLFTSATRGLLTCNDTNFFMVQSLPNPWRCVLIEQLQVSLYTSASSLLQSFSPLTAARPPLLHLSSELPPKPQLWEPLMQFTIHPRPLRNARRCFIHHKQDNGGSKLCSMGYVPSVRGSIVLATAERTDTRHVVAKESQLFVMPARRGTLLPFSKARRRALTHVNVTHNPEPGRLASHVLQSANSAAWIRSRKRQHLGV